MKRVLAKSEEEGSLFQKFAIPRREWIHSEWKSHIQRRTWKIWSVTASHGLVHFVESVLCSTDPMGRPVATETGPNPCRSILALHIPGSLCSKTAKQSTPLQSMSPKMPYFWAESKILRDIPRSLFSVNCGDIVQTRPVDSCISRAEFLNKPKEACMEIHENVVFDIFWPCNKAQDKQAEVQKSSVMWL